MRLLAFRAAALLTLPGSVLLTSCGGSPASLERATRDLPGVVSVEVRENDGDNDIPFATIPKHVEVRMEEDVTAEQVQAVFDAYHDEGDVEGVEVVLDGGKQATLARGAGTGVTSSMVKGLLIAQADEDVVAYRREAYPVLPLVEVELADGDFEAVMAKADEYVDVPDLESVSVAAGQFSLVRDSVNEDLAFTARRERFVLGVSSEFELTGALVGGRGPLRLAVNEYDVRALREFVKDSRLAQGVGRIVVGTDARPPD